MNEHTSHNRHPVLFPWFAHYFLLFPAGDVDEEGVKDQEATTEEQDGEVTAAVEGEEAEAESGEVDEAERREVDEAGEEKPSKTETSGGKRAGLVPG